MKSSCNLYEKCFDRYCTDELPSEERKEYSNHLEQCDFCSNEFALYVKTGKLIDSIKTPEVTESFLEKQHYAICRKSGLSIAPANDWVAPRYSLVIFLVLVGAYFIDGIGCIYISSSYYENVMSLVSDSIPGQYVDVSFVIYCSLAVMGIGSFLAEPDVSDRFSTGRHE